MDVDKFLRSCGDFNRYQVLILGAFAVINVLSSVHYFSQTIITFVPDYWCHTIAVDNYSVADLKTWNEGITVPYNRLKCEPLEHILGEYYHTGNDSNKDLQSTCSKWIYDLSEFNSLIAELDWVCDRKWYATVGQSFFFIGSVFGVIFGVLADRIGRLPVLILANLTGLLGNIATMFSTDVVSFSLSRFISGMATDSNFVMMYLIAFEYLRPAARTLGINLVIGVFYCFGSVITPLIALQIKDWRMFLEVTAAPILIVPFFGFILPESIYYLVAARKPTKALGMLHRVAKFNGIPLAVTFDDEFKSAFKEFEEKNEKGDEKENLWGLFKTPNLRKNMLILFFKSMVITLCYDAISKNVEGLGVSPFYIFSISATSILPACLVILLLQDRIGRKAMASTSLLLSGVITGITGVLLKIHDGGNLSPSLAILLVTVARFGIVVAYNSSAQYATEIIPSSVRGQGVVAIHIVGYAITFLSSYILHLGVYLNYLPSLVLGLLSVTGAVLCLLLPETMNKTLATNLAEAEEFGRGEPILYFGWMKQREERQFEMGKL